MKKIFESKIAMQISAVVIAVILWFIIAYSENPVIDITVNNIPISYSNLSVLEERGLTILKDGKTPTVSVSVQGNRSDLFSVIRNISAEIDLSTLNSSGSYEMPIDINIPVKSVELLRKKSNNATVVVEPIVTRTIPVNILRTGSNSEYLVKSSSDISEIVISGAKSAVSEVNAASVTVDVSDIKTDSVSSYSYSFVDYDGDEIESNNISSETTAIIISNKLFLAKSVPIKIEYPAEVSQDFIVNIKNADSLSANIGVLKESYDDVTSITAQFPSNISDGEASVVTIPLDIPDNVYIPDNPFVEVKADITKKTVKNVTLPVTIQNIPAGLTVNTVDDVNITVKGAGEELDPSLMSAIADLSGLTAGEHSVKLKITVPGGVSIEQDYSVNIILE